MDGHGRGGAVRDGYERERAVIALGRDGRGVGLPVLMKRANDWVPQVRAAAVTALDALMTEDRAADWCGVLDGLESMRRASRADHGDLLRRIDAFLARPAVMAQLVATESSLSADARRLLQRLRIGASIDDIELAPLLRRWVLDLDIVVARAALQAVPRLASADARRVLAQEACRSRYAAIRAGALRMLVPHRESIGLLRSACRDPSLFVRAVALRALREDPGPVIDDAQADFGADGPARRRAVALDVLCVLQAPSAPALRAGALADPCGVVRVVAYAWALRCATRDARDELIDAALRDPVRSVRRLAVRHVRAGASPPTVDRLLALERAVPEALRDLVAVAESLGPWARLKFLLCLGAEKSLEATRLEIVDASLRVWAHDMGRRSFIAPAAEQVPRVVLLWGTVRSQLSLEVQGRVRETLAVFGVSLA